MKKKIVSVMMTAVVAAATVFSAAVPTVLAADTVKIGVYEPASGDNGAGGKQETLGIQYANSVQPTVEIDGKEYNVELDIVDNESSNDKGPSAASKLVSDGVSVVLGSYGSSVCHRSILDIFKQGGVPAIGVTCTNPQVTQGNTPLFPYLLSWILSRVLYLQALQVTNLKQKKPMCLTKQGDDYSAGAWTLLHKSI